MTSVEDKLRARLPSEAVLTAHAADLYRHLTGRSLTVAVCWNRRLRTAGGRFSVPRSAPGRRERTAAASASIEINPRYVARAGSRALDDVLKHELAHYHLWVLGRPWGHTAEFRQLMAAWHFSRHVDARHVDPLRPHWEYVCPRCGQTLRRVRRLAKPASCAACAPRFDPRFRLRERRLV